MAAKKEKEATVAAEAAGGVPTEDAISEARDFVAAQNAMITEARGRNATGSSARTAATPTTTAGATGTGTGSTGGTGGTTTSAASTTVR